MCIVVESERRVTHLRQEQVGSMNEHPATVLAWVEQARTQAGMPAVDVGAPEAAESVEDWARARGRRGRRSGTRSRARWGTMIPLYGRTCQGWIRCGRRGWRSTRRRIVVRRGWRGRHRQTTPLRRTDWCVCAFPYDSTCVFLGPTRHHFPSATSCSSYQGLMLIPADADGEPQAR